MSALNIFRNGLRSKVSSQSFTNTRLNAFITTSKCRASFSRGFAQVAQKAPSDGDKPPKPKASTPLRRAAAASLPIRANPTPTRSVIQPVFTLATAERYLLTRLHKQLPSGSLHLHDSLWVPKWGVDGKEGEIFVFANGSFVCWGLGEEEATKFATQVLSRAGVEVSPLKEPETEDLEFVTDPNE